MKPITRGSRAYLWPAAVLIGLALTACGNAEAPVAGAPATSPVASPTPSADPNLIPSAPATTAFLDRASVVAQVVRAAGIPKPPEGLFLRSSSRTPSLAFDTTEQKLAWSAGQVVVAPGVRLGPGGRSRMDFADGSRLAITMPDARTALTGEIGTTRSNCRGVPGCKLVITGVSLGTAQVDTTKGSATVPVWSFTAKGLSRHILVVAVGKDVLKSPVQPVPPAGLPEPKPVLLRVGSLTRVEGNTLTISLNHGACDPDLRAHVVEFDDLVVIGGSLGKLPGACVAVLRSTPAVITLTAPLGDRAVIDATTGIRLTPDPPR
jgi:hypothetical protein